MAEQQQDVETLKRRGRRRLVGAIALVLLAVIVLPMVFDEPPPAAPPVSVRIPGEDDTPFKPKPPAPKTRSQYFVAVGAYANPQTVTAKLDAAHIPYYTEAAQGNVSRVRVGPFPSREAADQAAGRLRELGLQTGAIAAK